MFIKFSAELWMSAKNKPRELGTWALPIYKIECVNVFDILKIKVLWVEMVAEDICLWCVEDIKQAQRYSDSVGEREESSSDWDSGTYYYWEEFAVGNKITIESAWMIQF